MVTVLPCNVLMFTFTKVVRRLLLVLLQLLTQFITVSHNYRNTVAVECYKRRKKKLILKTNSEIYFVFQICCFLKYISFTYISFQKIYCEFQNFFLNIIPKSLFRYTFYVLRFLFPKSHLENFVSFCFKNFIPKILFRKFGKSCYEKFSNILSKSHFLQKMKRSFQKFERLRNEIVGVQKVKACSYYIFLSHLSELLPASHCFLHAPPSLLHPYTHKTRISGHYPFHSIHSYHLHPPPFFLNHESTFISIVITSFWFQYPKTITALHRINLHNCLNSKFS